MVKSLSKFEFDLIARESATADTLLKEHGLVVTDITASRNMRCRICGELASKIIEGSNFRFATVYCKTHYKDYCKQLTKGD